MALLLFLLRGLSLLKRITLAGNNVVNSGLVSDLIAIDQLA